MRSTICLLASTVVLALLLSVPGCKKPHATSTPSSTPTATTTQTPVPSGKTLYLKLVLPQKDAKVTADGQEIKGEGEARNISVPLLKGKDHVQLVAVWEPNNYTKITRPRKVTYPGKEAEIVVVDFMKPSATELDDIVVRFVATPPDVVEAMCRMAKITKDDVVYDLGCGDGRMVLTGVKKFGAKRGVGIDIDPELVKKCKVAAEEAGVTDKVEFRVGDVLKVEDVSDATVVLLYMGDDIGARLEPVLRKTLKPGSRVVSHRFSLGNWQPDRKETVSSIEGSNCELLLWEIKKK